MVHRNNGCFHLLTFAPKSSGRFCTSPHNHSLEGRIKGWELRLCPNGMFTVKNVKGIDLDTESAYGHPSAYCIYIYVYMCMYIEVYMFDSAYIVKNIQAGNIINIQESETKRVGPRHLDFFRCTAIYIAPLGKVFLQFSHFTCLLYC